MTAAELRAQIKAEFEASRQQQPPVEEEEVVETPVEEETTVETPATEDPVAEEPIAEATTEEKSTRKWRREIDMGDGSGKQVFEADTKDALLDKLTTAQENATRKIRELNRRVKENVKPEARTEGAKFEPRQLSVEEQFQLSQELQTNPTSAVSKAIRAELGVGIDDLRAMLTEARQAAEANKARLECDKFLAANSDYTPSPTNEKAMFEYLDKNNMAITQKNLELAFDELRETGLVSNTPTEVRTQEPKGARTIRKTSVGLSARASSADVEIKEEPRELSAEELLKLPPDERRRIVYRSYRR